MASGSVKVGATTAYAMVAVTPTAPSTGAELVEQFESAGFVVSEQPRISRTRTDCAVVLSAVRADASATRRQRLVAIIGTTTGQLITAPYLSFQPVWSIETWSRTGFELLVGDDDDSSAQLDALSDAIATPRHQITIKPTSGWQGYGWPGLQGD
jgi:hypothetical protein